MENVIENIVRWIKHYCTENHIDSLIIGVSGGIDSAVTSTLSAKTGLRTIVINMPIHQQEKHIDLGQKHIDWLEERYSNVESRNYDLGNVFDNFISVFNNQDLTELGSANSRARLRMSTLYQVATAHNGIVVGTGNKVEDFGVGFYTKYGDGGVDISPIADLMKSDVYEVAKQLEIVEDIILEPPTDGLWGDGRNDEDQIGATYDELEWAMEYDGVSKTNTRQKEILKIYNDLNKANKHKMIPIPVCNPWD